MRTGSSALIVLMTVCPPGGRAAGSPQSSQPSVSLQVQSSAPQQPPAPSRGNSTSSSGPANAGGRGPSNGTFDDVYSIERIKKALERAPALTFTMPNPNIPRYRVEIQSPHFTNPTFLETFKIPVSPVPQPFGGSDYYEMQRLITPPQFWGSAPFTNADLLKMWGLTGAYGLAGALIKKGLDARASAASARVHQEVQQELADLEAHNAQLAAGNDDAKKAAEKKKQAEEAKKKKKDTKDERGRDKGER